VGTMAETVDEAPAKRVRPEDMTDTERANLAAFMTPEMLKRIGGKVIERYERDLASRADRMKQLARLQKSYALVAEQKGFPWQNCANIKTPSLTGPNLQIQARLYDMIWPPTGKVFNVVPASQQVQSFAHAAEQFANAYVRYKMPYMAQGMDATLHQMCLYGSTFRRTYWDSYEGKVRSDWVPMEDFVVAYSAPAQDPSMSDVDRYTMLHRMSSYDLDARAEDGLFVNVEAALKVKTDYDGNRSEFKETADRIDGVTEDDEDDGNIRKVLEQHCKWRLPKQADNPAFDGREHYVMITVDAASRQVLRMSLREENDPDDQKRFDRQYQAYKQSLLAQVTALPVPGMATAPPPPVPGAQDQTAPPIPGEQTSTGPLPSGQEDSTAPLPPKPVRKRQICFFTHYRCFPSDGFYGLGYGDLLYGLTLAENTIINQWVDGQAVKNARPMFMSRQSRMARGSLSVGPGQVNEVDVPAGSIKDAIHFLDPPNSDPGTVPLIRMLESMRDIIAGNADLMSGQAPGSNQTKGGMQILNEQMMAPITVLARRVKEAFRHELDKIWRCWGVFLEDDEIHDVVGEGGVPAEIRVGKWMFTPSVQLVPASDPRMKSQRMDDLQGLTQFAMSMPIIAQDPAVGGPVLKKICEMVFRVFPDGEQLIPLLSPPPPPPPPPRSQLEENVGFLRGQDAPVHPADDDDQHLAELQMFAQGPEGQALDTKGKLMVDNHARQHIASRLQKRGQALAPAPPPGPPAGGPPPMVRPPGIAPPPGAPPA